MRRALKIVLAVAAATGAHAQAATSVTSIDFRNSGDSSLIEIRGNGPLNVDKQENPQDKQIVLELRDAVLSRYATRKLDTSSFDSPVSLISPYQIKEQPNTARIVIQMRTMSSGDLTQKGSTVTLRIPNSGAVTSSASAPEASPPAAQAAGDSAPPAPGAEAAEPPPVSSQVKRTETTISDTAAGSGSAKDIVASSKTKLDQFIDSRETKRFIGKPITLQVRDMDVGDVFRLIGESSGFNIVLGANVTGKITLSLVDVPWDQALDVVLTTQRLGAERNNNILRIVTLDDLTKEKTEQLKAKQAAEANAPRITRVFPVSFAKLEELQALLLKFGVSNATAAAAQQGSTATATVVEADKRTNSLIIRDTPENIERMKKLLSVLDTQTPQILIESKIVEASETFSRTIEGSTTFGQPNGRFNYFGNFGSGVQNGGVGGNLLSDASVIGKGNRVGAAFGIVSGSWLNTILAMNEGDSDTRTIASPKTIVLDKERASITSGDPVQLLTTTTGSAGVTTSVGFIQANLSLSVMPTVTNEGSVLLDLNISRDTPGVGGGIQNRNIQTKVLVDSGATLVIGGIYTSKQAKSNTGFPFLRKIPVLGYLFSTDTTDNTRAELFIFITPRILNPKEAGLTT